ncbi:hypothetical protein [Candidatus Binatus sp.]|uniref:hypothetical protein n=1 Tax=Candidatus Binatus sp. TaxID=2811406 RepID=UPI003BB1B0FC
MADTNSELAGAFPAMLREDALVALSGFPEPIRFHSSFFLNVAAEVVSIPDRIYYGSSLIHTLRLSGLQRELIDCLLTRHHNGYVRQSHLERIIRSPNIWIPPFVVQLVGEYVIEILQVIDNNLSTLKTPVYEQFARSNPEFIALTERRVMSYWNEYYRHPPWDGRRSVYERDEYVGFRLIEFFKSLARNGHTTGP